jgi:hypothetical protein
MKDGRDGDTFTISIRQFQQDLGLKDPQTREPMLTTVWGYDGTYPGPTIIARENVPLYFFWRNQLYEHKTKRPLPHLLPVDTSHYVGARRRASLGKVWSARGDPFTWRPHRSCE